MSDSLALPSPQQIRDVIISNMDFVRVTNNEIKEKFPSASEAKRQQIFDECVETSVELCLKLKAKIPGMTKEQKEELKNAFGERIASNKNEMNETAEKMLRNPTIKGIYRQMDWEEKEERINRLT